MNRCKVFIIIADAFYIVAADVVISNIVLFFMLVTIFVVSEVVDIFFLLLIFIHFFVQQHLSC